MVGNSVKWVCYIKNIFPRIPLIFIPHAVEVNEIYVITMINSYFIVTMTATRAANFLLIFPYLKS